MRLTFPVALTANKAFANVIIKGKQRRVPTKEYVAWKKLVAPMILEQWQAQGSPQIAKHFSMHYRINVNYQSDIGNREKCATDLIVDTIPGFPDDRWCDHISITRDSDIDGCEVVITNEWRV